MQIAQSEHIRHVSLDEALDEELFVRYREGEELAFEELVRRYYGKVVGFLRKRIPDEERANELAQDTFLRLHRARSSYDPNRKFSTWIHTIANNLTKNEYRNNSRRHEYPFTDLQRPSSTTAGEYIPLEFEDVSKDPEHDTYRGELRKAIRFAVDQMETHHREAFVMREIEDRTYEEISEAIGIPVGTVKSRLHRARTAFAKALPIPV